MDIEKSSRHQHIIGKFGEYLLCNWLSRTGFEVSLVYHTGLDVVAYNPKTKHRMGVTVKSRTRNVGTERTQVNIFSYRQGKDDRERLRDACRTFASEPWIAVYVETLSFAELYLTSLANYDEKYRISEGRALDTWKMSPKYKVLYSSDANVKSIRADFHQERWTW